MQVLFLFSSYLNDFSNNRKACNSFVGSSATSVQTLYSGGSLYSAQKKCGNYSCQINIIVSQIQYIPNSLWLRIN